MSEYKSIKGKTVQFLGTDPSETSTEGQVWYNSAAGAFKSLVALEAWSSGAPLLNARRGGASGGTQTAGLAFGGRTPPGTDVADTEEYNGSGWTTGGNLGTARYNLASATNAPQTAGLAFGSATSPNTTTEEYNGSSWTAGGALNTGRGFLGGAGTQTAGLGFGGYAGGDVNNVEEYNGTSWTTVTAMPSARRQMGSVGLQTAALSIGAYGSPSDLNVTEEYDGTNWTSGGTYPQVIKDVKAAGIQTNTLAFGGSPPPGKTTLTTNYDGTSWTTKPSMATPRTSHFGAGTSSAAFAAGGLTGAPPGPSSTAFTEEYNKSINVITAGAWASGANINTERYGAMGVGTLTAGLIYGGYGASLSRTETETYDGTSWSEVNDLNTGRRYVAAFGTQTAAVAAGGNTPPGRVTASEEYDGSTWTTGNSIPTAAQGVRGAGLLTSGLVFGGNIGAGGSATANTQTYDGTSYTEVNDLNTARSGGGSAGTQTAALYFGGTFSVPANIQTATEEWDGTSWTTSPGSMIAERNQQGSLNSSGSQNSALSFGGNSGTTSTQNADTQLYNGTVWVTQPSMASARSYIAGFGTVSSALGAGGYGVPVPNRNQTEEFTGETSAINIKTLTTS